MLSWGRNHNLTSRHHPRRGDVVILAVAATPRSTSATAGDQRAQPAPGHQDHAPHALTAPFTAFIHTRI
jgi:hypothetical protein